MLEILKQLTTVALRTFGVAIDHGMYKLAGPTFHSHRSQQKIGTLRTVVDNAVLSANIFDDGGLSEYSHRHSDVEVDKKRQLWDNITSVDSRVSADAIQ